MNMNTKQQKNRFLSILLSTTIFLTGILFLFSPIAKVSATEQPTYSKLYYFSDNPMSSTYKDTTIDTALNIIGLQSTNIIYNYFSNNIINYISAQQNYLMNITNALVIFEMRYGFILEEDQNDNNLTVKKLYEIFSQMKSNGCKIMFICGDDEKLFSDPALNLTASNNYNKFLDYVDIHVNSDIFSIFMGSLLHRIEEVGTTDYSLILSYDYSRALSYLIPFYRMRFNLSAVLYTEQQVIAYLNTDQSINIIVQSENYEQFTNLATNQSCTYMDLYSIIPDGNAYAIGSTFNDLAFANWINAISTSDQYLAGMPVYIYNENNTNLSDYTSQSNVFVAGESVYTLITSTLNDIMYDFITNNDLTIYNNWIGRCAITYKPLSVGSGGWLLTDWFYPCCCKVLSGDTYLFYHG